MQRAAGEQSFSCVLPAGAWAFYGSPTRRPPSSPDGRTPSRPDETQELQRSGSAHSHTFVFLICFSGKVKNMGVKGGASSRVKSGRGQQGHFSRGSGGLRGGRGRGATGHPSGKSASPPGHRKGRTQTLRLSRALPQRLQAVTGSSNTRLESQGKGPGPGVALRSRRGWRAWSQRLCAGQRLWNQSGCCLPAGGGPPAMAPAQPGSRRGIPLLLPPKVCVGHPKPVWKR